MPIVKCRNCSNDFYAKPSWIRYGGGKFCSLKCKYRGTRKGDYVSCYICGEMVYRPANRLAHSKSKKYFCSKSCQTKWRNMEFVGPKHANWKHGKNAYKSILSRNKIPKICTLCGITDKRVIAVHHIDHDHANNKLRNLAWLCHNCHHLVHCDSVERRRFLDTVKRS